MPWVPANKSEIKDLLIIYYEKFYIGFDSHSKIAIPMIITLSSIYILFLIIHIIIIIINYFEKNTISYILKYIINATKIQSENNRDNSNFDLIIWKNKEY